jgi:hypothetical protein
MTTLYLILYILAAVCFVAAAFLAVRPASTTTGRPMPNLIALGLFFWVLVPLIVTAKAM